MLTRASHWRFAGARTEKIIEKVIEKMSRSRAVVLLSGGLDSATTLAIARYQGFDCYALSVEYGQRHAAELEAAARVASSLGAVEHRTMHVDLAGIGGSALTDMKLKVPEGPTLGVPITYVPARNTILLSLALAWAEVLDAAAVFIGVNAVDYSVSGETRVWIRGGAGARLMRIADAVDLPPDNYETLAVDLESLQIRWKRLLGRYRHDVRGKRCFKVRLERGQTIEITEDHSLFTLSRNDIIPIRGDQIEIGMPLVAPFDLSEHAIAWSRDFPQIDLAGLGRSCPRGSSVEELEGFLTNRLRVTRVPLKFTLDDDFLRIVGLWLAEGGKEEDRVSRRLAFSIGGLEGAPALLNRYFAAFGVGTFKSPANAFDYTVNCSVFCEVFRRLDLLGTAKSGRKHLPAWFWSLSQRQRRIIVAGLWDGDGSQVWNGEACIYQKSHELILDLYYCLLLDGIFPTIKANNHGHLRLGLTRATDLAKFESLYPLWHQAKRTSLRRAASVAGRDKTTGMWKCEALWEEVSAANLAGGAKMRIYNAGGKYDEGVRAQRSAFSAVRSLARLRESRLAFLRVVSIEPVTHTHMYDLSVEDAQNFLAGGFLAHNSGYPDCRPEFIASFEALAALATKAGVEGSSCRLHAPLIEWTKGQIIREGVRLGVDYAQTVSCYQADSAGRACGRCDACRLRQAGFAAAGIPDPTRYIGL
jgi:7-cyano-7-deazaguanine synthase in queuosine biosynthesis/intein/homing endonuclease